MAVHMGPILLTLQERVKIVLVDIRSYLDQQLCTCQLVITLRYMHQLECMQVVSVISLHISSEELSDDSDK